MFLALCHFEAFHCLLRWILQPCKEEALEFGQTTPHKSQHCISCLIIHVLFLHFTTINVFYQAIFYWLFNHIPLYIWQKYPHTSNNKSLSYEKKKKLCTVNLFHLCSHVFPLSKFQNKVEELIFLFW